MAQPSPTASPRLRWRKTWRTADHAPSAELISLYKAWGQGGSGLIITGNVMVDARAMTGPGGVVLENDRHLDRFIRAWADTAGRAGGAQVWMQINHPGRQMPASLGQPKRSPPQS
jgi:2,4-dienoyl-CoA reductase-like NADH-dependent reductase (Old Yellow Enzyme family)